VWAREGTPRANLLSMVEMRMHEVCAGAGREEVVSQPMTDEEVVRQKWPESHAAPYANPNYPQFYCIRGTRKEWALTIGEGATPEKAWADARARIEAEPKEEIQPSPQAVVNTTDTTVRRYIKPCQHVRIDGGYAKCRICEFSDEPSPLPVSTAEPQIYSGMGPEGSPTEYISKEDHNARVAVLISRLLTAEARLSIIERNQALPVSGGEKGQELPRKDEVYALIAEVVPPPLCVSETAVRQLWPLLEELVSFRAKSPAAGAETVHPQHFLYSSAKKVLEMFHGGHNPTETQLGRLEAAIMQFEHNVAPPPKPPQKEKE
jgi:hypothetical protein